jgi:uncharacterized protein
MLTDEEHNAMLKSIDRVRQLAVDKLGKRDNREYAVAFVANLHRSVDSVASKATELGPVPECKVGCSYCCRVRVEATDPEVFRIAQRLRQQPERQVTQIIEKLRGHVAKQTAGPVNSRQDCSFLVNDRCSIYEVRPAVCRKAHSLSVAQCASLAPEIPQNIKLVIEAEALMAGTSQAYQEVNLTASAHELNSALLLALTDESAESRWYDGESVF